MTASVYSISDFHRSSNMRSGWKTSSFSGLNSTVTKNEPTSKWVDEVFYNIAVLARMPNNWDEYGAPRIDASNISTAMRIVHEMAILGLDYPPAIIPTVTGGLQLEWNAHGSSVELEVIAPYELYYFCEIGEQEIDKQFLGADYSWVEGELSVDLSNLYQDRALAAIQIA